MDKTMLTFLVVLSSSFYNGAAIQCFYCNSANNSACLDVNLYEPELRARILPIVNCEREVMTPIAQSFFCRKIVQIIYHPNKESEVRVTRGCGWIRSEGDKSCYRVDNADHHETACQCFHDYCNKSPSIVASITIMIISICLGYLL